MDSLLGAADCSQRIIHPPLSLTTSSKPTPDGSGVFQPYNIHIQFQQSLMDSYLQRGIKGAMPLIVEIPSISVL